MTSADTHIDAKRRMVRPLIWLVVFSVGMAFVETAVVVYLRHIFYPDGFVFPLRLVADMGSGAGSLLLTEVLREVATLVMLTAVAFLTGRTAPQRWACFMIAFSVWDIFYYVFLKLVIDWPATIFDLDVLFIIPWPWIAPVLAPVIISIVMIFSGLLIYVRQRQGYSFKIGRCGLLLVLIAIALMLFTFLWDTPAAYGRAHPRAYLYPLLAVGVIIWLIAFVRAFRGADVPPIAIRGCRTFL